MSRLVRTVRPRRHGACCTNDMRTTNDSRGARAWRPWRAMRGWKAWFAIVATAITWFGCSGTGVAPLADASAGAACAVDTECKGARVCKHGTCVEPGAGGTDTTEGGVGTTEGGATEAGATSCGFGGTDACSTCNRQSCCDEHRACASDVACSILLKCLLGCGTDDVCVSACGSAVSAEARAELTRALSCSLDKCGPACSPPADAGPACGTVPTLHPAPAGSIFCFTGLTCQTGQECCVGGALGTGKYAPEVCAPYGAQCPNGGPAPGGSPAVPVECLKTADCKANGNAGAVACCLQGATTPASDPECGQIHSLLGTGITCETTACGPGETPLCEQDADCPAGKTCTPMKWRLYQLGYCR